MFDGASSFNQPLDSWDISGCHKTGLGSMFRGLQHLIKTQIAGTFPERRLITNVFWMLSF